MTAAVRLATLTGEAPAASTPYIVPAYILEMIALALASALAGQNLSFRSCCLAFFPPFIQGAAVGGLPGREVCSQVSEDIYDMDVAADVLPHRLFEPVSCPVQPWLPRGAKTCGWHPGLLQTCLASLIQFPVKVRHLRVYSI